MNFNNLPAAVYVVLKVIALCICTLAGIYFAEAGFKDLQTMRMLQRMPVSPIFGLFDGPVAVEGSVESYQKALTTPHTGKEVVYYRYLKEEEYRDSDGDRHWRTLKDETKAVDFLLQDITGEVDVTVISRPDKPINWSTQRKTYQTEGRYRYSEWYIEPNNSLFVVGVYSDNSVRFDEAGYFEPLVSTFDKSYELKELGAWSIYKLWGGLALLSIALVFLSWVLQQHRVLFFLSLLTAVLTIVVTHYSLRMMYDDLKGGYTDFQQRLETVSNEFKSSLTEHGYTYSGTETLVQYDVNKYPDIPKAKLQRLTQIRQNVAVSQWRFKVQLKKFPELVLAPLWGVSLEAPMIMKLDKSFDLKPVRLDSDMQWMLSVACFLIWIALTWLAIRCIKVKRMIENLPTVKTAGMACGLNEVKGSIIAIPEFEELRGPLTHKRCCWYKYKVEEKRQSGKNTKWVTIETDEDRQHFLCEDEEGVLAIDPAKAEFITRHVEVERKGSYRYTEKSLRYGDELYALGDTKVNPDEDGADLILVKDNDQPLLLSNLSEKQLMLKKAISGMFMLAVAFSALLLTAMLGMAANGYFAAHDLLVAALACPLMFIVVMLILHFNDIIFLRNRADRNWANIQVSLKKRADLMKSLHAIVKKYMQHEKTLLEEVVQWRSHAKEAGNSPEQATLFMEAEQQAANHFRATLEDYPKIKAAELTGKLMHTLSALETEIALMRSGYNDAVEYYNTRIASFPDTLISKTLGLHRMTLIHYDSVNTPEVNFKG